MNIDMNSVLYLFLFILPGAFSKILRRRFSPIHISAERNKSSLIETSEIVVISFVIFCLNNLFAKSCRYVRGFTNEFSIIDSLNNADFLMQYILLTMVVTALFTFGYFYFDKYILIKIINAFNKAVGRPLETENRTIWEDIFEGTEFLDIQKGSIVMSIEKDGKILSRGMLREFPAPDSECDELILCNCEEIEEYFRLDATRAPEERYFQRTEFEYTILSKGITLKFYDNSRYLEFLKNPDRDPEWLISAAEVSVQESV